MSRIPLHTYIITIPAGHQVALRVAASPEAAIMASRAKNPYCTATLWEGKDHPEVFKACPFCGGINTRNWNNRKTPERYCLDCNNRRYSLATRRDKYWPDDGLTKQQQVMALYRQGATVAQITDALGWARQQTDQALILYGKRIRREIKEIQSALDKRSKADFEEKQHHQKISQIISNLIASDIAYN
jgi:hypothetical protein